MSHLRRIAAAVVLALALPALAFAQANGPITRAVVMQNAATALGNGTVLDTSQAIIAVLQTSGTFSGTVTLEATLDNNTWTTLFCQAPAGTNPVTGTAAVATMTTAGILRCNVAGILGLRARVSSYSSGSVTVIGNATSYPNSIATPN